MEDGFKPVLKATFTHLGAPYFQLVVFLAIYPVINTTNDRRKTFYLGVLIGGMVLVIVTFLCILVIGADFTARQIYPTYILAKKINIGNFLGRVEAVIGGIWLVTIYFKATILFYAALLGFTQMFKLSDYRSLTFPLAMILNILAIVIAPNINYYQYFFMRIFPSYGLTFGLFLPILLLVVDKIRNRR